MLDRVKEDVKSFMANRQKDDLHYQFINWQKKSNEIVVLTMYAFGDVELPKQYDIVFQIDDVDNYIDINYTIRLAIFDGWHSVSEIGYGHKHILILEFESSIPHIFNLLSDFDDKKPDKNNKEIGFCSRTDFESIKEKLKVKNE